MKTNDLRPFAAAALATLYTALFWAFELRSSRDAAAPTARGREPRRVWYDELPPSARPAVRLPPGWAIARAGDARPAAPAARVAPVAPARAPRIRTRSS